MNEESKQPNIDPELEARIIALVLGEASDFEREELNRLIEARSELATFKLRMQHVHRLLDTVGQGEFKTPGEEWKLPPEKRNAVLAVIRGEATVQAAISKQDSSAAQPTTFSRKWKWNFGHVAVALCVLGFMGILAIPSLLDEEFAAASYFAEKAKDGTHEAEVLLTGGMVSETQKIEPLYSKRTQRQNSVLSTPNRRSSVDALSAIQDSLGLDVNSLSSESDSVAAQSVPRDDLSALDLRGPVNVQAMEDVGVLMLRGSEADVGKVEATIQELEKLSKTWDFGIQQPEFLNFNGQAQVGSYLSDDVQIVAGRDASKQQNQVVGQDHFGLSNEGWFLNAPKAATAETQLALEAPQLIAQNDAAWGFEADQRGDSQHGDRLFRYGRSSGSNVFLQEAAPSNAEKIEVLEELSKGKRFDSNDVSGTSSSGGILSGGLSLVDESDEVVRTIIDDDVDQLGDAITAPSSGISFTDLPASATVRGFAGIEATNDDLGTDDGEGIQFNSFHRTVPTPVVGGIGQGNMILNNGDDGIAITATGTAMPAVPTFEFTAPSSPNSFFDVDPLSVQNFDVSDPSISIVDNSIGGERDGIQADNEGDGVSVNVLHGTVGVDFFGEDPTNIESRNIVLGGVQLPALALNQPEGKSPESLPFAREQLNRSKDRFKKQEVTNQNELPLWRAPTDSREKNIEAKSESLRYSKGDTQTGQSKGFAFEPAIETSPRSSGEAGILVQTSEDGEFGNSTGGPLPPGRRVALDGTTATGNGQDGLNIPTQDGSRAVMEVTNNRIAGSTDAQPALNSSGDSSVNNNGTLAVGNRFHLDARDASEATIRLERLETTGNIASATQAAQTQESNTERSKLQALMPLQLEESRLAKELGPGHLNAQALRRQIEMTQGYFEQVNELADGAGENRPKEISDLSQLEQQARPNVRFQLEAEKSKASDKSESLGRQQRKSEDSLAKIKEQTELDFSAFNTQLSGAEPDAAVPLFIIPESRGLASNYGEMPDVDKFSEVDDSNQRDKRSEEAIPNRTDSLKSQLQRMVGDGSVVAGFEKERALHRSKASASLNETRTETEAFSTFSLHVSDVSFKLAMAALGKGQWPEAAKIRIEEFVNALDYGDPMPRTGEKVACVVEQSIHPFLQQRNLLRISMKTAAGGRASTTPLRLTLLLDNSGSMERIDRQQTIRRAFTLLAKQLTEKDQVTLISFARQPRLLADSVSGAEANKLVEAIHNLPSEGGTNIEAALQLAFEKAKEHQTSDAQNRIVLLTDGAVNLGNANPESLSQLISTMRTSGIAFDAAGISADGLNDEVLEALTRKGDGRYYLLDSLESADDGFAQQIAGALRPSAKNVKVQVEFNPKRVDRYKLLGFEKHILKKEDFRNDKVDAAEMAAAEAGVAMYQFEAMPDGEGDVGSVSVRFQDLSTGQMVERRWPIPYQPNAVRIDQATPSLRTAASAALLAAKLKGEALAASVNLKHLSQLMSGLPEPAQADTRVQQLRTMIEQARQLNGQ